MPSIHLQLEEQLDTKTRELAQKLHLNRSAYIRKAVDEFNTRVERELLSEQFRAASKKCRQESLRVCHEFEAVLDSLPGDA
jgi:predicted transcriptional regulator